MKRGKVLLFYFLPFFLIVISPLVIGGNLPPIQTGTGMPASYILNATVVMNDSLQWDGHPYSDLISQWTNDAGYITTATADTNESSRFFNLTNTDCAYPLIQVGVYVNGTPTCYELPVSTYLSTLNTTYAAINSTANLQSILNSTGIYDTINNSYLLKTEWNCTNSTYDSTFNSSYANNLDTDTFNGINYTNITSQIGLIHLNTSINSTDKTYIMLNEANLLNGTSARDSYNSTYNSVVSVSNVTNQSYRTVDNFTGIFKWTDWNGTYNKSYHSALINGTYNSTYDLNIDTDTWKGLNYTNVTTWLSWIVWQNLSRYDRLLMVWNITNETYSTKSQANISCNQIISNSTFMKFSDWNSTNMTYRDVNNYTRIWLSSSGSYNATYNSIASVSNVTNMSYRTIDNYTGIEPDTFNGNLTNFSRLWDEARNKTNMSYLASNNASVITTFVFNVTNNSMVSYNNLTGYVLTTNRSIAYKTDINQTNNSMVSYNNVTGYVLTSNGSIILNINSSLVLVKQNNRINLSCANITDATSDLCTIQAGGSDTLSGANFTNITNYMNFLLNGIVNSSYWLSSLGAYNSTYHSVISVWNLTNQSYRTIDNFTDLVKSYQLNVTNMSYRTVDNYSGIMGGFQLNVTNMTYRDVNNYTGIMIPADWNATNMSYVAYTNTTGYIYTWNTSLILARNTTAYVYTWNTSLILASNTTSYIYTWNSTVNQLIIRNQTQQCLDNLKSNYTEYDKYFKQWQLNASATTLNLANTNVNVTGSFTVSNYSKVKFNVTWIGMSCFYYNGSTMIGENPCTQ
jgi:hypothetical protein